ncbi:MAG: O-antigen ligase family protein [Candidatus Atribacteria bacterium]|nr:O-antigen ligase family protein [Candidatus Atribacteria bacterium]
MSRKKINLSNHSSLFYTKAIEATIIGLIILVPIIVHPRCITVFGPAKEFTFEALVIIGLMFWVLKIIDREEIRFTSTPLNLPILSFIAICVFSLIWSDSFFVSLKELPLFLAGPLLYFIIVNNIRGEKQINRIIGTVVLIGAALGIYGIFQYNGIDFSFWKGNVARLRVFGFFGNPGYFAGYLILPLSLAISLFFTSKNRNRKILFLIGILAIGTAIILTFTRSSYPALGVSLIFMFSLFLLSRGKNFLKGNKKLFMILLIVIIIAASLFIIPTPLNKPGTAISQIKRRFSITSITYAFSFGRRIAIWKFTGMMIKDHPILGSGIGTFKYNDLRYQAKFFEQGDNRSIYRYGLADKAHNEYLQLWAELGTIGLAIFLWLIIAYFNYGIRYLKREKDEQKQGIMIGLMGAVVAFLVDGFFWFPLHLTTNVSLLWLFIGLTMVMGLEKKERSVNKTKRSNIYKFKPALYIIVILLAAFLCITVARPFVACTYWYHGDREVNNQNYNKAIKMYESGLKWDPYLGVLYYNLGSFFMSPNLYDTALTNFEKSAKYFDYRDLPQNLATIYLAKGDLDKAIDEFKRAISYQRGEGTMPPLYSELGNAYLKLERYEPAEAAFMDALKIDPNLVGTRYRLADTYLRQNKIDEGLAELKKVIELAPDSQEAKYARDAIQKIEQVKLEAQPAN